MNYAVIDLGSNTMRLSVYEHVDGRIQKTFSLKEVAGLAEYVSNNKMDIAGIRRACAVINEFKEMAYKFVDAANLHLFATASIRNVKNRDDVVQVIEEETSLKPDVLKGNEEAALGFVGVSRFANCENGIMIDIGGASTELVLFENYKPKELVSLPIGCLNLSVAHVSRIIPKAKEMKKINEEIKKQFAKLEWSKGVNCPLMVGTGGTLRAVLKLSSAIYDLPPEQDEIQARCVKEIIGLLSDRNSEIYHTVYKTTPERLMTISTGLAILQQAIKKFGCETISVSRFGIREGYLMDRVLTANDKNIDNESSGEA